MIEVAQWLVDEARGGGYEVVLWPDDQGDLSTVQALFCLAEQTDERKETLRTLAQEALGRGLPVIWAVEGEEVPGAFRSFTDFSKLEDAAPLLEAVLALPKPVVEEAPKRRLAIPSRILPRAVPKEPDSIPETPLPSVLPHVIAVGGPGGCGSSFVAWNLAAVLDAVLMEGRTTGALAKWLRVKEPETRQAFLTGASAVRWAVSADAPFSSRDLHLLAQVSQPVVVDVGSDWTTSEVWKRAGKKVFVVTPDPKYRDLEFPEAVRVMNRYPDGFPTRPDQIFQARMDVVIPDRGREVFMSLWAGVPWIVRQPDEVKDQWRQVFGSVTEAKQQPERVGHSWLSL